MFKMFDVAGAASANRCYFHIRINQVLREQPSLYQRAVDPATSFPDVRFAAQLGQRFQLLQFGFGLLLAGGIQKSAERSEGRECNHYCADVHIQTAIPRGAVPLRAHL